MADNMSGFWDSLLTYMGWDIFIMPILTILYVATMLLLHLYRSPKQKYPHFAITMLTSLALSVLCNYLYGIATTHWGPQDSTTTEINEKWGEKFNYYFPFGNVYYWARKQLSLDYNFFAIPYVKDYSVIGYFPACFVYSILSPAGEIMQLSEYQRKEIDKFIYKSEVDTPVIPKLILFLSSLRVWNHGLWTAFAHTLICLICSN